MSSLFNTDLVITCYHNGYFPMADSDEGEIYWHFPDPRAIFDIYHTKIPRSIRTLSNSGKYHYRIDTEFEKVITYCSERETTWINQEIIDVYCELNKFGFAHSVEVYNQNQELVGGLYGVAIGGAFFGESMFNKEPNTAKLAFVKLIEILRDNKFLLLDSQYINDFTKQLGAFEISADEYLKILRIAVRVDTNFKT